MSKYSEQFEQIKTQKEMFVDNFVNDFDVWFEQNKNQKNNLPAEQVDEILKTSINSALKLR